MPFAHINLDQINFDCRFYTGYKPCGKFDGCPDCPHYEKRGEQILIIKLGAMGDVLRCKVILRGLKDQHPESWIVWLTEPGSECLVRDPLVDEIRIFTPAGLAALSGRKFARLICLDKDAQAVALARDIDAEVKQGFAPTEFNTITVWNEASLYALRLGLSDPLKFYENTKSMPEIVAEASEVPYDGERYTLTLTNQARREALARWTNVIGEKMGNRRVIGLNTGCGPVFATKGWTQARMEEFLQLAGAREDLCVALLGGPRERSLHAELMERAGAHAGESVFDLGNDNPLEVFFGLVEQCDVVCSADSLGMHVAIALGRPVVAWFGSTCHQEVDLYGLGEKVVSDFPCSPCYLKHCPKPVFCLDAMSAETVLEKVDRLLTARRP